MKNIRMLIAMFIFAIMSTGCISEYAKKLKVPVISESVTPSNGSCTSDISKTVSPCQDVNLSIIKVVNEMRQITPTGIPLPKFSKAEYLKLECHQRERALTGFIIQLMDAIGEGNNRLSIVKEWVETVPKRFGPIPVVVE